MTATRYATSLLLEFGYASRSLTLPFASRCYGSGVCKATLEGKLANFGFVLPIRWFHASGQRRPESEGSFLRRAVLLLQNYKQLSKAKLSALVVLTAGTGYVQGSGDSIGWEGLGWTCLGTFACAACANSLNQLYETVNDSFMQRTRTRPLPSGRLGVGHALLFAAATGIFGVSVLATQTNATTAALGASNIVLYAGIYTPLKQVTMWNTWLGAVVGAIPPLMGWAAASGELNAASGVLAATLYFWQLPHFLALAWMCKDDYIRGGFKMISMLDPTGKRTAGSAVRNCICLLPVGLAATALGVTTSTFTYENTALSLGLAYYAIKFWHDPTKASARSLFRMSLLFLPLAMACSVLHRIPQTQSNNSAVSLGAMPRWLELTLLEQMLDSVHNGILNLHAALLAVFTWYKSMLWPGSNDLKCPSKAYGDPVESAATDQPASEENDE